MLFGSPRSETAPAFSASPDGDSSWQLSIASFPQTETQPCRWIRYLQISFHRKGRSRWNTR